MRALPALAAALLLPGLAAAAEPRAILGGEHTDFSRLVLPVAGGAPFTLRAEGATAELLFPGRALAFDTTKTLARLSRGRIAAVSARSGPAGTRVTLTLGCDCAVSATRLDGKLLALDVAPAEGPAVAPPPSRASARAARDAREAGAVASAEAALLRQLERAAAQGVVDFSDAPGPAAPEGLDGHPQVEAITVFDRDRPEPEAPPPGCLPDARFDVAAWSRPGGDFPEERAAAEAGLLSEFDAADPAALARLVRLNLRFGLGLEAEGLLAAFPTPFPERALLADLARVLEARPADPAGPLLAPPACPGAHGLWQALAGRAPETVAAIEPAFAALPGDFRRHAGPALVGRLLDAGRVAEARAIFDLVARAGLSPTPEERFAEARLLAAERRPSEALTGFADLASAPFAETTGALIRQARLTLHVGAPTPALALDLATAARTERGGAAEPELRALAGVVHAASGDLAGGLAALAEASAALPASQPLFAAAATRALAAADPDTPGPAAWAGLVLGQKDLIARGRATVPARLGIARRLLALGLPAAARDITAPLLTGAAEAEARRLAAEAELRLGHPAFARALTEGLDDAAALELRAEAEAASAAYAAAVDTLAGAGLAEAAAPYAFPAGDWTRVRASADPTERAMAAYMSGAAPAEGATPAEAAFAAPRPSLARPSLAAPRELLANGPGIAEFIRGLLGPEAARATD